MSQIEDTVKSYILCSWNLRSEEEQSLIPRKDFEAMGRLLEHLGYREVSPDRDNDADLIVVFPRDSDLVYTLDELIFFHCGLGGERKKVLYIHSTAPRSFIQGRVFNWLFFIRISGFDLKEFKDWITCRCDLGDPDEAKYFNPSQLKNVFKAALKAEISESLREISKSGYTLINSDNVVKFFFGLHRICGRFSTVEHIINRELAEEGPLNGRLTKYTNKKRYLHTCVDLHDAMILGAASAYSHKYGLARHEPKKIKILIIDDNPDYFIDDLKRTLLKILHKFLSVVIWNPSYCEVEDNKNYMLCLEDIERYNSSRNGASDRNVLSYKTPNANNLVKILALKEGEADIFLPPKTIIKVLSEADFVFVDILLHDQTTGRETEKGLHVIRGLQRLCRDAGINPMPNIMAISRAESLETVHKALSAGAMDYSLKSRVLGMASSILRNWAKLEEPANTLKRNFWHLYKLPLETLGLLRSIFVPNDRNYGIINQVENSDESINQEIDSIKKTAVAKLLTILPKTDLHVHAGSCMSPEFLVVASLVMLARHEDPKKVIEGIKQINQMTLEGNSFILSNKLNISSSENSNIKLTHNRKSVGEIAEKVRNHLKKQLKSIELNPKEQENKAFRSILHRSLGIEGHKGIQHVKSALDNKQDLEFFLFALRYGSTDGAGPPLQCKKDDLVRIFILWLASKYPEKHEVWQDDLYIDLGDLFENHQETETILRKLKRRYYTATNEPNANPLPNNPPKWHVSLGNRKDYLKNMIQGESFLNVRISYKKDPISYLMATGTRSHSLKTYLEGCEIPGSEHLRHPYLIKLYAQQTIYDFVRQGIMYAEIRAAASGYATKDGKFSFDDACRWLKDSFGKAQKIIVNRYLRKNVSIDRKIWLWEGIFNPEELFDPFESELARFRFPVKVSLIFTGKRHKPQREMMIEAAAGMMYHTQFNEKYECASDFMSTEVPECRIVGFDLAGPEEDWPPNMFASEYERLARNHIPVTAHAGENAPYGFVEDAIIDLRARRVGHGLALADDKRLMDRIREERICVELCPVSNCQTNWFVQKDACKMQREYPLKIFLDNGNAVSISTDNPVISNTNMVKEYFQASYVYGGDGLSLWEVLRIIRMGFIHSFLSLPDRRAMIELADQIIFDLFYSKDIVYLLKTLAKF